MCQSQGVGICSELSILASQVRTLESSVGTSLKMGSASAREATADALEAARRSGVWKEGDWTVSL